MQHLEGLFAENAEAWEIYRWLCGRTVRDCQLEGWLFDRVTAGWDLERVSTLLARLDLIGGVLSPPHGPTQNRHPR